ncbi:DUF3048 domain-containing protein [Patescibacteria group bacterium]|nr:DUF3048 domain-containing protein [Patescibacteria group bacterium]
MTKDIDLSENEVPEEKPISENTVDLSKGKPSAVKKAGKKSIDNPSSSAKIKAGAKKSGSKKGRTWKILLIVLAVLLVAAGTYAAGTYLFNKEPVEEVVVVEEEVVVEEDRNELERRTDGVLVATPEEANKFPVAIMIENLSTVRPQSGLEVANIVYETLAEGGITRFMAIFAGDSSKDIHPVRSARPYYLEWVQEYKALYGHAGGSPQALEAISGLGVHDLNALSADGKYFWRGPGAAPHNLYTSTTLLERAVRDKGLLEETPDFQAWKFEDEAELADRPEEVEDIKLNFSSGNYNVKYEYDRENNCYKRFHVETAHEDKVTGMQLCPKNVVIQEVPPATSAGEKGRINLDVTGEGRVVVLTNGEAQDGTWKKVDRDDRTKFFDDSEEEIPLTRGQVWIEVIPSDKSFEH